MNGGCVCVCMNGYVVLVSDGHGACHPLVLLLPTVAPPHSQRLGRIPPPPPAVPTGSPTNAKPPPMLLWRPTLCPSPTCLALPARHPTPHPPAQLPTPTRILPTRKPAIPCSPLPPNLLPQAPRPSTTSSPCPARGPLAPLPTHPTPAHLLLNEVAGHGPSAAHQVAHGARRHRAEGGVVRILQHTAQKAGQARSLGGVVAHDLQSQVWFQCHTRAPRPRQVTASTTCAGTWHLQCMPSTCAAQERARCCACGDLLKLHNMQHAVHR